jgi:hypothetical protein
MKVDLAFHGEAVTVMSEGGEGMGPKDLERRYLRWGKSAKRGRGCSDSMARVARRP